MAYVPCLRAVTIPYRRATHPLFASVKQNLTRNRQHPEFVSSPRSYTSRPVFTPLIVNGQERPASNGEIFEVHRSHSGTLVGIAASATYEDCHDAINAASQAFKTWETSPLVDRRDIFIRAAELLKSAKYAELFKEAFNDEVAIAPYWCQIDLKTAINIILAQLGCMDELKGEFFPSPTTSGAEVFVHRRAKGAM